MKRLILSIAAIFVGFSLVTTPVFAAETSCVQTAILGENHEVCDDGEGSGIKHILELVVEIMTVGVGILATIGLSVAGVQYLTAGGSEEQTRKAKRRIFEIVIGLAAYVLIYAILYFLLPDFKPFS